MNENDVCSCSKWGISCMIGKETPEGLLIIIDWNCPTMEFFRRRDENSKNLKHILDKGGEINA